MTLCLHKTSTTIDTCLLYFIHIHTFLPCYPYPNHYLIISKQIQVISFDPYMIQYVSHKDKSLRITKLSHLK